MVVKICITHYNDVIMSAMASQITSLIIVYSIFYSSTAQRKYQSSASLAFMRGIHRWPVVSPHKWPVTRKMFPFDDVIMLQRKDHQVDRLIISLCFKNSMTVVITLCDDQTMIIKDICVPLIDRWFRRNEIPNQTNYYGYASDIANSLVWRSVFIRDFGISGSATHGTC